MPQIAFLGFPLHIFPSSENQFEKLDIISLSQVYVQTPGSAVR